MTTEITDYNKAQPAILQQVCNILVAEFDTALSKGSSKLFHRNPAWFIEGNPIVGYYIPVSKDRVRIMFWSGQSFEEPGLQPGGSFKAATKDYISSDDIDLKELRRWLAQSQKIQWDYKNIVKNKGILNKIDT